MTITDIDKQFDEKFIFDWSDNKNFKMMWRKNEDGTVSIATDINLKDFLHQIYSQAKAEQREEIIQKIRSAEVESEPSTMVNGYWSKLQLIDRQKLIKSIEEV